MKNKKILFLYTGGHPLHLGFAKSINADIKKLSWKIPKNYDVYFTEGEFFKTVLLQKIGLINKKSTIINLFSDPRLFYYNKGIHFNNKEQKVKRISFIKSKLFKFLLKKVNGVICVGKFEEELLKKIYEGPYKKIDIFVERHWHSKLLRLSPNLDKKRIIFIGSGPDSYYKGIDILSNVAQELKDFEFIIIGEKWDNFISLNKDKIPKNLKFIGKKNHEEIYKILKEGGMYLHLGRGEAFGIVIIEAMSAGIIPIISELTGAKEAVEKVDKRLIVPLEKEEVIKRIMEINSLDDYKKESLSKKCKKISKEFEEKKRLKEFKKNFLNLLDEIENEKRR
jgi:glycosyltransferase involved in cell wall biosynthesis